MNNMELDTTFMATRGEQLLKYWEQACIKHAARESIDYEMFHMRDILNSLKPKGYGSLSPIENHGSSGPAAVLTIEPHPYMNEKWIEDGGFWYEIAINKSLRGLPTDVLRYGIATVINNIISASGGESHA